MPEIISPKRSLLLGMTVARRASDRSTRSTSPMVRVAPGSRVASVTLERPIRVWFVEPRSRTIEGLRRPHDLAVMARHRSVVREHQVVVARFADAQSVPDPRVLSARPARDDDENEFNGDRVRKIAGASGDVGVDVAGSRRIEREYPASTAAGSLQPDAARSVGFCSLFFGWLLAGSRVSAGARGPCVARSRSPGRVREPGSIAVQETHEMHEPLERRRGET